MGTLGYAIETQGLSKVYGEQTVVQDLSIHVPRDGIYGFLGPNGAGKSTTMKVLLGLVKPSGGQITAFPNSAGQGAGKKMLPRRLVGSLIEGPAFYPNLSAEENAKSKSLALLPPASTTPKSLKNFYRTGFRQKAVSRILAKLGMRDRVQLAIQWVKTSN
ncbi:MAG: ATP-binding cassette domain-containing protein [Arcanobacterium sp.]|nr:ATP-binding cassette domain-containing protein [Arcanobacterium sp.]